MSGSKSSKVALSCFSFFDVGVEKLPFSSRLAKTHAPEPSQYKIFRRLRERFENKNNAPLNGSSRSRCCAYAHKPLCCLRMSTGSSARKMRVCAGTLSIAVPSLARPVPEARPRAKPCHHAAPPPAKNLVDPFGCPPQIQAKRTRQKQPRRRSPKLASFR